MGNWTYKSVIRNVMTNQTSWSYSKIRSGKGKFSIFFLCFLYAFLTLSAPVSAKNYTPVTAEIPVYCEKVVNDPSATYLIRLELTKAGDPAPSETVLTVKSDQTGVFSIPVTEPGTYVYRIYQSKGTVANMKYDEEQYDVYLCVVNDSQCNLSYTLSVTAAASSTKPDKVKFTNILNKPVPPSPDPVVPEDPIGPPKPGKGGWFSGKTGENTMLYVAIYGGSIGALAIAAAVYIILKRKKDKKED